MKCSIINYIRIKDGKLTMNLLDLSTAMGTECLSCYAAFL